VRAFMHPVWRRVILAMVVAVVISCPLYVWGSDRVARLAWVVLVMCSWGPALIMGVFDRMERA
jgi:hypothetical protein